MDNTEQSMQAPIKTSSRLLFLGSHRKVWLATNLLLIVVLLLATRLNPNIGYANGANCDSWYFFGIYQDYFHLRSELGDAYQFNRFPAIIPWIFLGPHISATELTEIKLWTYFLVSAASFSFAAICLFGSRIGSVISILCFGSTLFMGALSTDFVTGAGLAWECALIGTAIQAVRSARPGLWICLIGAFCACCVYTHIPMAMFIFSIPLYLLLRPAELTMKGFLSAISLMLCGFLIVTALLCLTSLALNGDFFFFKRELFTALSYVANKPYHRPQTGLRWLAYDANIPVFLLALALSSLTLIRTGIRGQRFYSAVSIPAIAYAAVAILCFGFEFSGRMVLQENVFAPWMLPSAFLAIGSAMLLDGWPSRFLSMFFCVAAACVLLWAACRINLDVDYRWRYILAAGALFSLAMPVRAWSPALAGVCILGLLAIDYPTGYGAVSWYPAHWSGGPTLYSMVQRAHRFIADQSDDTHPVFWVSGEIKDMADPLFISIATPRSFLECAAFPASYPSDKVKRESWDQYLPGLGGATRDHYIRGGQKLFIIARGHDLVASASAAFQSVGLHANAIKETEIAPGVSIAVAAIE